MEIPDNELDDLDQLLRHVHGYLHMAIKFQMHPDETQRLARPRGHCEPRARRKTDAQALTSTVSSTGNVKRMAQL
jgi:hypothetical protein